MIGGPNLRYVRIEPPLAQCTGLLLLLSLLFCSLGVCIKSGLRDSGTLVYILSSYLLRLMVSRRVPRAISPWATLRWAHRLSIKLVRSMGRGHKTGHLLVCTDGET